MRLACAWMRIVTSMRTNWADIVVRYKILSKIVFIYNSWIWRGNIFLFHINNISIPQLEMSYNDYTIFKPISFDYFIINKFEKPPQRLLEFIRSRLYLNILLYLFMLNKNSSNGNFKHVVTFLILFWWHEGMNTNSTKLRP